MISKPKPYAPSTDSKYIVIKNDGSNMADLQALLDGGYAIVESWVAGNSVHHLLVRVIT